MEDMLKDFVVEALELATNVEEHLLALERQPDNMETLNAVFRSFHTIKGGAGFMSLSAMVSACHLTENLFDALRTGKAPVTGIAIEAALQASGFVADQLTDLANGAQPEQLSAMPSSLEAILRQAIEGGSAPTAAPAAAAPVSNDAATAAGPDWAALYHAVTGIENEPAATGGAATAPEAGAAASGWDGIERRQPEPRAAARF